MQEVSFLAFSYRKMEVKAVQSGKVSVIQLWLPFDAVHLFVYRFTLQTFKLLSK